MKLIVGLGNPGKSFISSRHNVGFKCVDYLARNWGIKLAERRAKATFGRGHTPVLPVVLAKPRTFMNNSGEGVKYLLTRFAAQPADLVIIHDDMDLPVGKIRIRPRGGAAGHKGIASIIAALSTREFPRIRVGVGRPPGHLDGISYVLGTFLPEENPIMQDAVAKVSEAVVCLLNEDIQAAMNKFN